MSNEPGQGEELLAQILASRKYRNVCPDLIRRIGAQELASRRSLKQALKATKNRLHQVGGAYLEGRIDYGAWLEALRAASEAQDSAALRQACAWVMGHHASSRERLPILDTFYATALEGLPPVRSVLDVACGLNPLAIPWMPLAEDVAYYACDIYQDMAGFLGAFLTLIGVRGSARACDIIQQCPAQRVDLALILKSIPCLEQAERDAGRRLLEKIDAGHLLISFPAHSLGGARKGMAAHYEARLHELLAGASWSVRRFEFESELAFLASR